MKPWVNSRLGSLAAATLVVLARSAAAQPNVAVAGGFGFPVGDYAESADMGWLAHAEIHWPAGPPGMILGAGGFLGRNGEVVPPAEADSHIGHAWAVSGLLALVGYTSGSDDVQPYVFGGPGFVSQSITGADDAGPGQGGPAVGVGGGLAMGTPGRVRVTLAGSYLKGMGNAVGQVNVFDINLGIVFPVGS